MILVLEERNGEYEYCHRSVHKLPDEKTSTIKYYNNYYLILISLTTSSPVNYPTLSGWGFLRVCLWCLFRQHKPCLS